MKFHILTLFPEMVTNGLNTSIIGRAAEQGLIEVNAVNIRDYTQDKHGKVDDYPYGGGAGMLMQAQPVFDAYGAVCGDKKVRTLYMTPQGQTFTQHLAEELAEEEELVFLCGHYEGIDERVLEEIVTDYVSIGDYVLTGGELPAMVMIDAISRLVPGVLNNEVSAETESFHNDLLEYPQYSRPETWHGKKVPAVLLSGNHKNIRKWRLEQSEERTRQRRPDLYAKYQEKCSLIKKLSRKKRETIHMMELLSRGNGEVLVRNGENLLLLDRKTRDCHLVAEKPEMLEKLLEKVPKETKRIAIMGCVVEDAVTARFGLKAETECFLYCYTRKETLPVKQKEIQKSQGEECYVLFEEGTVVGSVRLLADGSMELPVIYEGHAGKGYEESLEAYLINRQLEWGWIPYIKVEAGTEEAARLQDRLGLYGAEKPVRWYLREDDVR